jgi:outer membrane protein TolC
MKKSYLKNVRTVAFAFAMLTSLVSGAAAQGLSAADAAGTLPLTIEEAVRLAIEHNADLSIVRLDGDVQLARIAQSRSAFTPLFATTFARASNATPPSNFLLGTGGVTVADLFSSTGVQQRLQWGGGAWSLSWNSARTTSNSPISSFDPSVQSGFQFAFSQPLVKDRSVDEARHQYGIAKRNQAISDLQLREAVVQTVAAVKQAYWLLKAAQANVAVQQQSLDLAVELARQNRIRVAAGQNPPVDLVQAEAEVAQRRDNLIRATATAGDAEDGLKRLIIDPSDAAFWNVRLNPVDEPSTGGARPDVNGAVEKARSDRSDIARAGVELQNARDTVEFLDNQRRVDVRIEGSYGANGLGGTQLLRGDGFPGAVIGRQDRGLGDSLGQVFTSDFPTWSIGFTVNYPLGHSYEAASFARAEVERRQKEQAIASLQVQAVETVRRAGRQIQSAVERIDAARAGETLAQQRLQDEQRRYDVGLSTTFLVTQAQRDLVEARVTLLQTLLDYESALVNFEAVQQAPPRDAAGQIGVQGGNIVALPAPAPRGLFPPTGLSAF